MSLSTDTQLSLIKWVTFLQQRHDDLRLPEFHISQPPALELIINLKHPSHDLRVLNDQHRESVKKLPVVVHFHRPGQSLNAQIFEQPFCLGL